MSHEQTITIDIDGKFYNIPTVVRGKKVSDKEATDYHIKNGSIGKSFNTLESAVEAAKKRSKSFKTILD